MNKLLLFGFFLLTSQLGNAKGAKYHYFLKGIAFAENREVLRNQTLVLEAAGYKQVFKTNENGEYELKIRISFFCKSGEPPGSRKDRPIPPPINYKTISIYGVDFSCEIPNNWEKYKSKKRLEKDSLIEYQDLHLIADAACAPTFKAEIESFEKSIKVYADQYRAGENIYSLRHFVEKIPMYSDTSDIRKYLGEPIDMGFDYRYLSGLTGKNGCAIGAVFHIDEYGKIDQKWVDEICE